MTITGMGVGFQEKTNVSEEEEGHVQCSEVKEDMKEANKLHIVPPGDGGGVKWILPIEGEKAFTLVGWPSEDGYENSRGGNLILL